MQNLACLSPNIKSSLDLGGKRRGTVPSRPRSTVGAEAMTTMLMTTPLCAGPNNNSIIMIIIIIIIIPLHELIHNFLGGSRLDFLDTRYSRIVDLHALDCIRRVVTRML